jgi:endoglucanase
MRLIHRLSWTTLLLLSITVIIGVTPAVASDTGMRDVYKRSYLAVSGRWIETRGGRRVTFHGVNVGGWLVTENWMCGFEDSADRLANGKGGIAGRSAQESLEARFGASGAAALVEIWRDHWITAQDLDRIRDGGFNLIRVPISYRTLQHADGSWIRDARGNIDFRRMDWIVREAAARGIYTIFDLHVWPEQRTDYEKIGRADGAGIRQAMAELWREIAAHYRGNGAIAAFDLINEFPGNWGVQQVLSRAVSQADPRRLQVIEGFTHAEFLKLHAAGEFPNSIYSDHFYGADPLPTEDIAKRLAPLADSPVPVYIGEFLAVDFAATTRTMDQAAIGWSSWTYKTVDMGEWGIINYYATAKTDIQKDAYDDIVRKWSTVFTAWKTEPDKPAFYTNQKRVYIFENDKRYPIE